MDDQPRSAKRAAEQHQRGRGPSTLDPGEHPRSRDHLTARREAERALRESERFVQTVLESIQEGLIVYDRELRALVWNRYMERLSGLPADRVLGREATEAFPHLKEQGVDLVLRRALAGEAVEVSDVRYFHPLTGEVRWYTGAYAPHRDAEGTIVGVVANIHDVTERKRMEERLVHDALHDALTGLPNKALFVDRVGQALERARHRPEDVFAVLYLDLDRFKVLVDSLGYGVGDRLLVYLARRLQASLRNVDTVARVGGDEFAVLLDELDAVGDATRAAERLLADVRTPFDLDGHEVFITGSIGIALGSPDHATAEDILRDADIAMHRAKSLGRGRHQLFDRSMHERAVELHRLETDLRRALDRGEFRVVYQPLVSLATGRVCGLEALLRWRHPERGEIPPDHFIPLAEETGLIVGLGHWTLDQACAQLRAWQDGSPQAAELGLAVNISGRQFSHDGLADEVRDVLRETGLDPGRLTLEITESAIVEDTARASAIVRELDEQGVRLHIDDFGVGYSSLSSLHRFPIDGLKIDRSFVARMGREEEEIVRTVVLLGHSLGMEVTAEGVAGPEQLAMLRALACDFVQGDFLAPALEAPAALALVESGRRW
jgi:diguanylate cyclase (GGDEF)-like protein/PAS domain S-box-containing protein